MRRVTLFLSVFLLAIGTITGKEGMWIPLFLEKYNLQEMQSMGFNLSADDIYSDHQPSMKDAVVIFGGGCTGEMISDEGLLLTNHHCGYSTIQSHSTVENNYLQDGFWAMSRSEELPNPGLTVRFLQSMEDVTSRVYEGTEDGDSISLLKRIDENISNIKRSASEEGRYSVEVKPLFYGNRYFLYIYKVYKDIRLVGAPPSSIGKFGADTDNWMWPRHSGDFALFRVYARADNEPAEYSKDNIPFKPKKYFPISIDGVKEGDFTLVLGNPGSTSQYIPSHEVDFIKNERNPYRIALRDRKLKIIGDAMEGNPKIRVQYSSKYASISNAWKKWQGEMIGLDRMDALKEKREFEERFKEFSMRDGSPDSGYKNIFRQFDSIYPHYYSVIKATDYYSEIVFNGVEIFKVAAIVNDIISTIENKQSKTADKKLKESIEFLSRFFKDYDQTVDAQLFRVLTPLLHSDLSISYIPSYYSDIFKRFDEKKMADRVFWSSLLINEERLRSVLESGDFKSILKLRKDPMVKLYNSLNFHYESYIRPDGKRTLDQLNESMKKYMSGIMEMKRDEPLYPDANFTMRVTFGQVEGYEPVDGVRYKYYTTLDGVMEKDDPDIYEFNVPERLRQLYHAGDYGRYSEDGHLPVCFTASNHTSGGNSGSPVIDGDGYLKGINFDRCWEGTMSDIMYDPERSRNISVDIRYILFIIEKYAGAGYLLDEMEIISSKSLLDEGEER